MSEGDRSGSATATTQLDSSGVPPVPDGRAVQRHAIVATAVTASGGLIFGYDTGAVSGAAGR